MEAAAKEPPELAELVGWTALGGVSAQGSPRCFYSGVFYGGG
jgi:hypothetical protein